MSENQEKKCCSKKWLIPLGLLAAVIIPFIVLKWCPTSCKLDGHKGEGSSLTDKVAGAATGVGGAIAGAVGSASETLNNAASSAKDVVTETVDIDVDSATDSMSDMASDAVNQVTGAVSDAANTAGSKAKELFNAFGEKVGSFFSWSLPNGESINIPKGGFEEEFLNSLKNGKAGDSYIFDRIFFASGSSNLSGDSEDQITSVVKILNAYSDLDVLLRGHTDSRGSYKFNQRLSENRARSLRDALIQRGISPSRIQVKGLGPDQPVADNETAKGRQLNRRIDISVSK